MSIDSASDLLQAIRALPREDRLRLVELVVHELARETEASKPGPSIIGLFADEAELLDDVCRNAMEARKRDSLRAGSK